MSAESKNHDGDPGPSGQKVVAKALPKGVRLRAVIIDDEKIFAEALQMWLERAAELTVVGQARDGETGWELCVSLQPDFVFLDVGMPESDGFRLAERLNSERSRTRLIILAGRLDQPTAWRAAQTNVEALIDKPSSLKSLLEAISVLKAGGRFICPVFQRIRERMIAESAACYKILSNRELEVLSQLTAGKSDEEIAGALGVSVLTIIGHRWNIRHKLELHDDRSLIALRRWCGTLDTLPPSN